MVVMVVRNSVDWIALILVIVGGLNWGLIGLLNFDLVAAIFGMGSLLARVVYTRWDFCSLYDLFRH